MHQQMCRSEKCTCIAEILSEMKKQESLQSIDGSDKQKVTSRYISCHWEKKPSLKEED